VEALSSSIAEEASGALNVLDRFHIMRHMSKTIDEVRAKEAGQLKADGYEPILKHSRWCLLKRPENLSEKQEVKLADLVRYNLRAVRSYLLKEDFRVSGTTCPPTGPDSSSTAGAPAPCAPRSIP
jgi:transposase